jgi:hypothetical protein
MVCRTPFAGEHTSVIATTTHYKGFAACIALARHISVKGAFLEFIAKTLLPEELLYRVIQN